MSETDQTTTTRTATGPADAETRAWGGLLGDTSGFSERWTAIQNGFVDEPRRAVEDADRLVVEVVQRLVDSFAATRSRLEQQWSSGDQVGTEDLRIALQRYRAFFDELLHRG